MTTPVRPGYAGYRFPAEVISHAVWLYFAVARKLSVILYRMLRDGSEFRWLAKEANAA